MSKISQKLIVLMVLVGTFILLLLFVFLENGNPENDVFVKKNICEEGLTDLDGNVYETVSIGNRCWMAENLKTTTYRDGTPVPKIEDHNEWWYDTEGSYALYDYTFPFRYTSKEISSDEEMFDTYGLLYNFYAVKNPSGLCPEGWKVPSDEEWQSLERYLGMSNNETEKNWYRGTDEGSKLAGDARLWSKDGILGQNFGFSGFNALPAGYRRSYGDYGNIGSNANFWTEDERDQKNAFSREIFTENKGIYRITNINKNNGHSVRCIKE